MRRFFWQILFLAAFLNAHAQNLRVSGSVTYLSAGTVYASIGWEKGIQDSTMLFVVVGADTTALLKVLAVSSKSCACRIIAQSSEIVVGNSVVGWVTKKEAVDVHVVQHRDTTNANAVIRGPRPLTALINRNQKPFMQVQGRMSLQYYSSMFDNSSYNFSQPGLVLNLRATSPDAPLQLDFYGNLRTLARGGMSPFSRDATNASRIYRFSIEYDDQTDDITAGRIIPLYASSIGSIDGISYARRIGSFIGGASVGFQPPYDLQGLSSERRKVAVFAQYQLHGSLDVALTGAYARTYFRSLLDREAISLMVNGYTSGGLSVYGYSDVDLRSKQDDQFKLSPSISMASVNVNYRFTEFLTVGIGADASRPVFPFSTVQFVADTLLDRTLHSGATFMVNISLMDGLGVFNTYSPRSTNAGFGSEYLNSSTFFLTNVFSTGATVRGTYMMNENQFTSSRGYGLNLEKNLFGVDLTVRYQQNRYRLLQLSQENKGETVGADMMALFTEHLSFIMSFDSMHGFGPKSYTVFSELSWRF